MVKHSTDRFNSERDLVATGGESMRSTKVRVSEAQMPTRHEAGYERSGAGEASLEVMMGG